jgi:hypothetical protein
MFLPLLLFVLQPVSISGNAGQVFRQPQIVVQGHNVYVAFGAASGGSNEIYCARSNDGGQSFAAPVRIASVAKMDLGRHRGPRIAVAGKSLIVTAVIKDPAAGFPGDLVAWRSEDGGKHWSTATRVDDSPGSAEEGLHDLSSDGQRFLVATWLDHRALKAKQPDVGPQLYAAFSTDGGRTWAKNVMAYSSPSGRICECCHPNAIIGPQRSIYLMFRNHIEGNRDEYLVESRDAGRSFGDAHKLGSGTWPLKACPMDGGGLAMKGNEAISVFRRDRTIYTASGPAAEHELGPGKDADIAITKDGNFFIWTSPDGVVVLGPDSKKAALLDAEGGFGQLQPFGDRQVIAAWESPKGVNVKVLDRTAVAGLPSASILAKTDSR